MAKKRIRSPKYPIFGLKTAIERIAAFYERERTASVPRDLAVKAWQYSKTSGIALQTVSTLTQYGLLERTGEKNVKVSEIGLDILVPKNQKAKNNAIQTAANRPKIFRELKKEYPEDLPSDDSLRAYLIRRQPPYNEDSANKIIKSFKETLEFAKIKSMGYNEYTEEKGPENTLEELNNMDRQAVIAQNSPIGGIQWTFPISGKIATLIFQDSPTQQDLELVKKYLDVYKEGISSKQEEKGQQTSEKK